MTRALCLPGRLCQKAASGLPACPAGHCHGTPATFPDHIRRDGVGVWRVPAEGRQCIACGAKVPAGRSEVCPHE